MEFNDGFPQYEILAQHSEEEGKGKRKVLWRVFWIMLTITIAELIIGIKAGDWGLLTELQESTALLKFIFIGLTLVKAYFIVYAFMHLGHEYKFFKWVVIAPYSLFIVYLIYMMTITEGLYSSHHREEMDDKIVKQQTELRSGHGDHDSGASHEENHESGEHHDTEEHH